MAEVDPCVAPQFKRASGSEESDLGRRRWVSPRVVMDIAKSTELWEGLPGALGDAEQHLICSRRH